MSVRPTKIWKVAAFFFFSSTALLFAFAWWLPRTYYVSRSTVIAGEPEVVLATVSDLQSWPKWVVWLHGLDPTLKLHFGQTPEGPEVSFSGEKLGVGRFVMLDAKKPSELTLRAEMPATQSSSLHRFQVEPEGESTRLVWSMIGQAGDGFFASLTVGTRERLAVRDFDESLAALKACIEGHTCE